MKKIPKALSVTLLTAAWIFAAYFVMWLLFCPFGIVAGLLNDDLLFYIWFEIFLAIAALLAIFIGETSKKVEKKYRTAYLLVSYVVIANLAFLMKDLWPVINIFDWYWM